MSSAFLVFGIICVSVLKEVNRLVVAPYMDEPFHIPQAQAYCEGDFAKWDPKITTPPGLYIMSVILRKIFAFKCTIPMLRLTTTLTLLALPLALTGLLCYHKRERQRSVWTPSTEGVVLAAFPIVWFYGFLYYTEVPSLLTVVLTVVAASKNEHWLAALIGLISCTFRQTNIIWVLYAYASSQLMKLRFQRVPKGETAKLHDPSALDATPADALRSIITLPKILPQILPAFIPYALVLAAFGTFVVWNGGIVLGDKSNHIPTLHVPQVYYFAAFCTCFGWPILLSYQSGPLGLASDVWKRMFGGKRRSVTSALIMAFMAYTVKNFTIHHPFLLSDNRHYTFYVWKRIFLAHPVVPYLLIPVYLASAWAWFLRVGGDQTLLQNLLLPVFVVPTLLPTPLLEPRYFLIPYVLLRAQAPNVPGWSVALEGLWYAAINAGTMYTFCIYLEKE